MAPVSMRTKASHVVEKRARPMKPSSRKGSKSARTKIVREVIYEVAGLAPYEKRLLDMLKTGGASAEKRMYKFAKQRLGTHKRAVKKREDMKDIYAQIRARQAML